MPIQISNDFDPNKIEIWLPLYHKRCKPIATMLNKTDPKLSARAPRPARQKHYASVQCYRDNTTDKCPKEIAAAKSRSSAGIVIGSREYMEITPTCDRSCGTKYHWCPTCFLAPRCDCMMPHFSPVGKYPNQLWHLDQVAAVRRFENLPCDNRYWTMANEIRAAGKQSSTHGFCKTCALNIRSASSDIDTVHGRTYLELVHHIWIIIADLICGPCITMLDTLECAHSGGACPSNGMSLVNDRLINYESRGYVGKHRPIWNDSIKVINAPVTLQQRVPRIAIPIKVVTSSGESQKSPADQDSFAVLPQVISSILDDDAPMLLASQLMNLWFPDEDDAPLGTAVNMDL